MTSSYTLYGRPGSGSVAVQVALEEIGAPYQRVWVGSEPADVERFRAVNPAGKVPALQLPDGSLMFESAAILIHLAALHPAARLAPAPGSSAHGPFLQWMVFMSANVYEAVLRAYYAGRYSVRGEADAPAIQERGAADLFSFLELLANRLSPYVLGPEFSIADVYLYMLTGWFPGEKSELYRRLPQLGAHAALIASRPSVVKVEADNAT